jgi:diacylglycerol kinase
MSQKRGFFKSFDYAGQGLKSSLKTEPNLRIHFFATIITILAAIILRFSLTKFAILILTISFVITLELINTVIEEIMNIVSPQISPSAKLVKDVSAATVLVGAIGSAIIGVLLFLPDILKLFGL